MMRLVFRTSWIATLCLILLPSGVIGQARVRNKPAPEVSGQWIVFRQGVTQMIGNKPLAIKGDCRTVVVQESYHPPRTMAEGRIKAKQFIFKVCCKAKTIQVLKATYIGLDGQPLLKSLKPGRPTPVRNNPLIRRMHGLACRLPLKLKRRATPPTAIR